MTTTAEDLAQNMAALEVANARRISNATFRREIRDMPENQGRALIAAVLLDPDPDKGALPIGRLLGFIRKWGVDRTRRVLKAADVRSADRRVRDLTPRQRRLIADVLRNPQSVFPSSRLPKVEDRAA